MAEINSIGENLTASSVRVAMLLGLTPEAAGRELACLDSNIANGIANLFGNSDGGTVKAVGRYLAEKHHFSPSTLATLI